MQSDPKLRWKAKMYNSQNTKKVHQGFTLIELMVALVVFAIGMAIAIPSYKKMTVASQLTVTNNELVSAIGTARIEAMRRGRSTQFCSNGGSGGGFLGTACGSQLGAVYASQVSSGGAEVAELIKAGVDLPSGQQVNSMVSLVFDGRGIASQAGATVPYSGTVAIVCSNSVSTNNQRVITMITGTIVRSEKTTGGC